MKSDQKPVTQKDFKQFKKDIKQEFKKFSTKDDLKNFATKDELDRAVGLIYEHMVTKDVFNDAISKLRAEMMTRDELLTRFDQLVTILMDTRTDLGAVDIRTQRHEDQIDNHEKRLTVLER